MSGMKWFGKGLVVAVLVTGSLLAVNSLLHSEEKRTHISGDPFNPGDIISADVLNEIFARLRNTQEGFHSEDELVGTWTCDAFYNAHPKIYPYPGQPIPDNWKLSKDGLFMSLSGASVTFSHDGDGTYSFTTSAPNPFHYVDSESFSSPYELVSNWFFYQREYFLNGEKRKSFPYYSIEKINQNKFILRKHGSGGQTPLTISCTRQNPAPFSPTNLTVTLSGSTVTLSWTDNSHDETGFKILRKSSLTDSFSQIATVSADVTGFSETLSGAGEYWYRVRATNNNGDSMGSNLAKITVGG